MHLVPGGDYAQAALLPQQPCCPNTLPRQARQPRQAHTACSCSVKLSKPSIRPHTQKAALMPDSIPAYPHDAHCWGRSLRCRDEPEVHPCPCLWHQR